MNFVSFFNIFKEELNNLNIEINEEKGQMFYKYMNLLLYWNEKVNLTAITEPKEIMIKHFVDSLSVSKYIFEDSKLIDIGTGAGFPGIPLAIYRSDIKITLLDSLKKRVDFLEEVHKEIGLENIFTVHGRAEDYGRNKDYRENFDFAISRAVAPLNILAEYLIPFVKIGGFSLCMKGPNVNKEIEGIQGALEKLGGKLERIENIKIKDIERNILFIKKENKTQVIYPRKAGIPSKKPLE